ncbi:MAG: hypothetical protein IJX99_03245, partial [Clostridia bacterium]|nr:hypothetical protein [Clostridia bacterium]
MKRRKIIIALLLCVVASCFAGCGAKETVADGINTQPAQGVMDDADTETDVVVQEVIKEVTVVSTVTNT